MTKAELNQKIAEIERLAESQKRAVYKAFAEQNAIYKVGDIVGDATDKIRVECIHYHVFNNNISIFYYGPLLNKKGEPRKDGAKRAVYESNIKTK